MSHSSGLKPKRAAAARTITAAVVWILKLGSFLKASRMPEKAKPKLLVKLRLLLT